MKLIAYSFVAEVPFDAQRRRMTMIHQFPVSSSQLPSSLKIPWQWHQQMGNLPYVGFTKGAVASLLEICTEVWVNDKTEILTQTTALTLGELIVCLALSTVVFWGVELEKWLLRRRLLTPRVL